MSIHRERSVKPTERTPLISEDSGKVVKYGKSILYRALFCGFLVSLSFGVTQVPLIYVFRLMTCEAYYATPRPDPIAGVDRCSNHEIEAATARSVALLGASTTLFGVANLFVTGWLQKKYGIRTALFNSVFWPAVRLAVQNIGVMTGGNEGILIVQSSQIITILGGPAGYILALNSYVTEIVETSERTGALGSLQGYSFLGTASAYLIGGQVSDFFGILAPFRMTLGLFLTSSIYVMLFLPYLPLSKEIAAKSSPGLSKFFGPLKIFSPQSWISQNGVVRTEYGTILLGLGVFLGVLATGYIATLLQMYATDIFEFGTSENGYLISLNSFVRGLFLTIAFPRIIGAGRRWMIRKQATKNSKTSPRLDADIPDLPIDPVDFSAVETMGNDEEPIEPAKLEDIRENFDFDLFYTRYSLLADAVLTGAATFINKGWQMYVIAVLLPLAAGTGSSAKGTILQMCSPAERADALSAITLVEMVARLATVSLFGLTFAALAEIGKTYLVFTCNAAVALVGFCVLLLSRFPAEGSERYVEYEVRDDSEAL